MTTTIKFLKHCVTNGTVKARVHYSLDNRADKRECVTIYAKDYTGELGQIFQAGEYHNDTDLMTDYFDKGRVVLFTTHPLYAAARARAQKIESDRYEAKQAKLTAAFNRVAPKDHWKNPIDAEVTIANNRELRGIYDAVIHFTGSVPTFKPLRVTAENACVYRVKAAGYYATIGA